MIERQEATFSTVTLTVTGTDGAVIPQGTGFSTSDTSEVFLSDSEITIAGATSLTATAENSGQIEAVAGTITVITNPIFGLDTVNNPNDASLGEAEETDAELRARREKSTQALGQNLTDSLFGQLLDLDDVTSALVRSNGTDATDANGIPPHSFLTVIEGGEVADIANTIWMNNPQGIASHGSLTEIIVDSQGFSQEINYSRAAEIDIFFSLTISTDSNFPATGQDDIKAAMVTFGSTNFGIGKDVLLSQFYTPINSVVGVTSIDLKIGTTASPTGTSNITIGLEQISKYDTTRIELIVS